MNIKELKEAIAFIPDDTEVVLVHYSQGKNGKREIRFAGDLAVHLMCYPQETLVRTVFIRGYNGGNYAKR